MNINSSGIYIIANNLTNDIYGGSSVNINNRWKQHCNNASKGSTKCPKLYNAMRKYGIENFSVKQLIACAKEDLYLFEQRWLDVNVTNPNCYNISISAEHPTRGRPLSEDHKNALRKPKSVRLTMGHKKGIKLTDPHKQNISMALIGKKKTKTHVQNIIKAVSGKPKHYKISRGGSNNPNSKLTKDQVNMIKQLFNPLLGKYKMYKSLADQFNVSWNTIRNVVIGATYEN